MNRDEFFKSGKERPEYCTVFDQQKEAHDQLIITFVKSIFDKRAKSGYDNDDVQLILDQYGNEYYWLITCIEIGQDILFIQVDKERYEDFKSIDSIHLFVVNHGKPDQKINLMYDWSDDMEAKTKSLISEFFEDRYNLKYIGG